jgi:DNA-binding beta-propeller fold protein YncE
MRQLARCGQHTEYQSASSAGRSVSACALLYVSDGGTDKVSVYSYPSLKLVQTISGLIEPNGLCVNQKTGAIWVAVSGSASQIVEFAHGGTKPIRTLEVAEGDAVVNSCAVDPTSGNIAVADAATDDPGDVMIFDARTGKPATYFDKHIFSYEFVGYDASGNLFVDGSSRDERFRLDELPSHGKKLIDIPWQGPAIRSAGNVQYDGTDLPVGDSQKALIYQTVGGKVLGTTALGGACYVDQYFIDADKVIVPSSCSNGSTVSIYHYPAGGTPIKIISGFKFPFGTVISR